MKKKVGHGSLKTWIEYKKKEDAKLVFKALDQILKDKGEQECLNLLNSLN